MKWILGLLCACALSVCSLTATAGFDPYHVSAQPSSTSEDCGDRDVHPTDADFCQKFTAASECACKQHTIAAFCQNMPQIYHEMMSWPGPGSIDNACNQNAKGYEQQCKDNWNCAVHGGTLPDGVKCSNPNPCFSV